MRANHAFLLRFGQHIHGRLKTRGPIRFRHAMHQADVKIIRVEFAAKAVQVRAHFRSRARPGFRHHGDFAAIHVLQRVRHMRMAAVGIRGVEKTQSVVVPVLQQARQSLKAQRGLIRVVPRSHRACSHREQAKYEFRFVRSLPFPWPQTCGRAAVTAANRAARDLGASHAAAAAEAAR